VTPVAYFRSLAELLEQLRVTDGLGASLELEAGAHEAVGRILEARRTGKNPLRSQGAINFWVNAGAYGLVEAAHTVLTHYLTNCATETRAAEHT
jgi:hypothetical protein